MDYRSSRQSLYPGIGEQIMLARRRAGLNQAQAGVRLGITAAAFSDLERGKTRPNLDNLFAVADALGVPLSQLVVLERPHPAPSADQDVEE